MSVPVSLFNPSWKMDTPDWRWIKIDECPLQSCSTWLSIKQYCLIRLLDFLKAQKQSSLPYISHTVLTKSPFTWMKISDWKKLENELHGAFHFVITRSSCVQSVISPLVRSKKPASECYSCVFASILCLLSGAVSVQMLGKQFWKESLNVCCYALVHP